MNHQSRSPSLMLHQAVSVSSDCLGPLICNDVKMLLYDDRRQWEERCAVAEDSVHSLQQLVHTLHTDLAQKEETLAEVSQAHRNRVAQETLTIHYEYEDRLRSRDAAIDELREEVRRLQNMQTVGRSAIKDFVCQVGDSAFLDSTERVQLQQQQRDLQAHWEALLAAERSAALSQKQTWDELIDTRLQMERSALQGAWEKERIRWAVEKQRLETVVESSTSMKDECEARITELETTIATMQREWDNEREAVKKNNDSLGLMRRTIEDRLSETLANHKAERERMQHEFQRSFSEQDHLYEGLLRDEKESRLKSEEELALLRADRNRALGEFRSEKKGLEHKLLETQLELTKRIESCRQLEDQCKGLERSLSERDREVQDKCSAWEELASRAMAERASMESRMLEREHKIVSLQSSLERTIDESNAALQRLEHELRSNTRRELEELEKRHHEEVEMVTLKMNGEHLERSAAFDDQRRRFLDRIAELEKTIEGLQKEGGHHAEERQKLLQSVTNKDSQLGILQRDIERWKSRCAVLNEENTQLSRNGKRTMSNSNMVSTETQTPDDPERLLSPQQQGVHSVMLRNQQIWTLQAQLHQSQQDVQFLEETVENLNAQLAQVKSSYSNGSHTSAGLQRLVDRNLADVSPLRQDEVSEAEALMSYFHR